MSYQVGEVVNGHRFNGADWVPVQTTPPPPPVATAPPPAPNPHAMGQGLPPAPPAAAPGVYVPPPPVHAQAPAPVQYTPVQPPAAPQTYAGGNGQPGRVKTGMVRFSYLFVNPRDQKGKQRVTLLFPKSDPNTYPMLCAKRDEAIRAKVKGEMPQYYRDPIKDGDTYRNPTNGKPLGEECRGHWVINAVGNTNGNVELFDQYGFAITAPGVVKSGDWGRASITFYYSNKDNNVGVNVALNSLIFYQKGDPLSSSGISAEDEFAGEFAQAPQGYTPPGHGYQAPQLPPPGQQNGYTPQAAPGGFAPPPGAPQQQAPAAQPMVWSDAHQAWVPNTGTQHAPPPAPPSAPPAPPPVAMTPPGPPPGAPLSPDGKYWWNATSNAWVPL